MAEVTMDKIISLCRRRGFIFQSSEIYGGLNGAYDYGPMGVELKNNIRDFWWKEMTQMHDNIVGLDPHAPEGMGGFRTCLQLHRPDGGLQMLQKQVPC